MPQKYKVYFANRPVIFTSVEIPAPATQRGVEVFLSQGKMDTVHIEAAIRKGAKKIYIRCADVERAWNEFSRQFEFVQAAGGLVVNQNKQILFIYRLEKWDLPKGKVEEGEQISEGALREVREECSIEELHLVRPLLTTWHTYMQGGEPMLKSTVWYLMEYSGHKSPSPQQIEGITETRWLGTNELEIVLSNTYPSVLDVIEAYTTPE